MHACMPSCMYACTHVCVCLCIRICMYACMHVRMYVCSLFAAMYACMSVCPRTGTKHSPTGVAPRRQQGHHQQRDIIITIDPMSAQKENTPREKNTQWSTSFQSTTSEAGEQFLLKDCRARACAKGVCFHRHRQGRGR